MGVAGCQLVVWQCVVFGTLWMAYGSTYLVRKPLGVIKAELKDDLALNDSSLGWLDLAFLLPYALVSIALGSVGDLLGPRWTLGGGLLLTGLFTLPLGQCTSLASLLAFLVLVGTSQSLCWPAACTVLGRWFSDDTRNTMFGFFGTCCFVFGLVGTALAVSLQAAYGWHGVFEVPAIVVAVLGGAVLLLCRDPAEWGLVVGGRAEEQVTDRGTRHGWRSLMAAMRIPLVVEVSMVMFCIKLVRYALMFWLPLYLHRSLSYSQVQAGLASTAFEVGGMVGSAGVGLVVDKYMKGYPILASALAVAGSAFMLLAFVLIVGLGPVAHVICLTIAGALNCGPDILLAGSVSSEIGERAGGLATTVTGLVNGMGSLGTVLEGPLVSILATTLGWGALMPLMVLLSCLGALAAFRAHLLHCRNKGFTQPVNTHSLA